MGQGCVSRVTHGTGRGETGLSGLVVPSNPVRPVRNLYHRCVVGPLRGPDQSEVQDGRSESKGREGGGEGRGQLDSQGRQRQNKQRDRDRVRQS